MPAASPIWPSVRLRPESGSASLPAMLPTMVTSSPSRIQVMPRATTTSQCHLAHGSRSNLDGIRLSTAPCAAVAPLLTHASPLFDQSQIGPPARAFLDGLPVPHEANI